ncbi:hypothetical protein ACFLU7_00885, partial [Chloroflexota bacterium]
SPDSSMATDLDIGSAYNLTDMDVTGLAISGNTVAASLLAGTANSTQVYVSTDGGDNWKRSGKKLAGQSNTEVLMAADFTSSGIAYSATSGTESAFSYTTDGGITWNQVSLIDTKISQNGIIDLAISPNYSQDSTLYMLTFDGEHQEYSLWRSQNGGGKWGRVFTSTLGNADSMKLVGLPSQYGAENQVVFLVGTRDSNSVIWKSKDNGQTFARRDAPFTIDILVLVNDNTLFLGSYNGSDGLVYRSTNGGLSYSDEAVVGSQPLESLVLSPNYEDDGALLVGNTEGWVYWSEDNGTSFKRLGQQLPLSSTGVGRVSVAFDPNFSSNKIIYAASDAEVTAGSTERIYRFTIGKSYTWESIDSALPVGSLLSRLVVSADGTLYATSSQSVDAVEKEGGMERSLDPTYPLGPTFETVTRGLDDGATLTGLWLKDSRLWSIDTQNTRLMTYIDSLALLVAPISPSDKASGISIENVNLDWGVLKGATKYKWQLDYETDFSTVPSGFEGEPEGSSARLPTLKMATTYYWRVRATEPVLSPWSAKYSFTTSLGTAVSAPELYSPEAGDSGMPIKPLFQWSAISGADSYELLVATEPSFSQPVIVKVGSYALPSTAYQSDLSLDYNTTYYWKTRACGSNNYSIWSAAGVFTTELAPIKPSTTPESPHITTTQTPTPTRMPIPTTLMPSPSPPPSPPPLSSPSVPSVQSTIPEWVVYLTVSLLLTTVILLVTLLVLVAVRGRT